VVSGVDILYAHMGRTQESCHSLHGFLDKALHVPKFGKGESKFSHEEYQEYLTLKFEKFHDQGQSSSVPSVSMACISEFVPLIIFLVLSLHSHYLFFKNPPHSYRS